MATWKIGDATIHSGGYVEGDGRVACTIDIDGEGYVSIGEQPCLVELDPSSDWMLDRYAHQIAQAFGLEVTTDYKPRDEDIPESVRGMLGARKRHPRDPHAIY